MWPVERLKKRLVMLFSTRVCLQQAVNCALWLVCVVRESWSERGLSLIEVTWCYNSHMLPVGRKTTLTLPPWLSPHLTSWPKKSSTDKKNKSKLHKHWEFRVYQGFDITWRGSWVSLFLWKAVGKLCPCESHWFYETCNTVWNEFQHNNLPIFFVAIRKKREIVR